MNRKKLAIALSVCGLALLCISVYAASVLLTSTPGKVVVTATNGLSLWTSAEENTALSLFDFGSVTPATMTNNSITFFVQSTSNTNQKLELSTVGLNTQLFSIGWNRENSTIAPFGSMAATVWLALSNSSAVAGQYDFTVTISSS